MAESEKLVKRQLPIASLERLNQLGFDPAKYGSCSEKKHNNVGCGWWKSCPFGKQWGMIPAFKGTRPHNLGYYIKPLRGPAKTDWTTCYAFCADLYARMRGGLAEQAEGNRGEVIRIIAKEGDEIPYKVIRSKDPNCNKSLDSRLVVENLKIKVPVFLDPLEADKDLAFAMEIEQKYPMSLEAVASSGVADEEEAKRLMAEIGGDIPLPDEAPATQKSKAKNG